MFLITAKGMIVNMIIDNIKNAVLYYGIGEKIRKALKFLEETDFSGIEPGKYEIDGTDLFYMVQHYKARQLADSVWEAHKKYIDIQYVFWGEEIIGYSHIDVLSIKKPYDESGDAVLLDGKGDFCTVKSGFFMILNPEDAHMPGVSTGKQEDIKKVVVKIAV